MTVTINMMN